MTANITYRLATFEDSVFIDKINRASLPENYSVEVIIGIILSGKNTSYVAIDSAKNKIIGYCLTMIDEKKNGHIASLAVSEEYRGKTIGKRLLLSSMVAMRKFDCEFIYLHVRPSNTKALALYEKMGFTLCDKKKNYYEDKEDGYIMVRTF